MWNLIVDAILVINATDGTAAIRYVRTVTFESDSGAISSAFN